MRFEVMTQATPEQVFQALTDFTDRRLETWRKSLDPKTYEVRERGDTWAVARESTAGSPFWVVSRYDWSDPALVSWTLVETSWGGGGTGEVRIAPTDSGGSRLEVEWGYTGATRARDKIGLSLIQRPPMRQMIARSWAHALDQYARGALD